MYRYESRVRYSEVDREQRMTLGALLNYFQDCCTFQSEELGVGVDYLKQQNAAWVLSSWQVEIKRLPMFGEQIQVCTWPYDFGGFYGYRNFVLKSAQGETLAYANSVWVFMDITTGRPNKILPKMHEVYVREERLDMDYLERKIAIPEGLDRKDPLLVHPSQLDTNNHVNNEKYIEMAQAYLPADQNVVRLRAEYKKSAVMGDIIYPAVAMEAGKTTVVLGDEAGNSYAVVEFFA